MFTTGPDDEKYLKDPCGRAGEAGDHAHSLGGCQGAVPAPHVAGQYTQKDDVHVCRQGLLC